MRGYSSIPPSMLNKDYREMLQYLSDEEVKFLLVGAYALAAHGFPRATKDIDFFVWANAENGASLLRALERFGAPIKDLSAADFAAEGAVFQIGVEAPADRYSYAHRRSNFSGGLRAPVDHSPRGSKCARHLSSGSHRE
jgi:nucleotidyltransferase AbiEii toxin of type IV toxin-antitoxin system